MDAPALRSPQERGEHAPARCLAARDEQQVRPGVRGADRETVGRDPAGVRGAVQRVGDRHAAEPELPAQELGRDRPRPAGRVHTVVAVVDGVREHDERHALRDGLPVRGQPGCELGRGRVDPDEVVVGVRAREPQPREVLHRRERVRLRQPERERTREPGRLGSVERPGAALPVDERRPRRRHVGDRREVDVDPQRAQPGARAAPLVEGDAHRARLRRRHCRRDPRDRLDRAALLIDGDEEPRLPAGGCRGVELPRDRPQLRGRREVEAVDDHAADLAAPGPRQQRGRRRGAAHRYDELLPDELRQRRRGRARRRRAAGSHQHGGARRERQSSRPRTSSTRPHSVTSLSRTYVPPIRS